MQINNTNTFYGINKVIVLVHVERKRWFLFEECTRPTPARAFLPKITLLLLWPPTTEADRFLPPGTELSHARVLPGSSEKDLTRLWEECLRRLSRIPTRMRTFASRWARSRSFVRKSFAAFDARTRRDVLWSRIQSTNCETVGQWTGMGEGSVN